MNAVRQEMPKSRTTIVSIEQAGPPDGRPLVLLHGLSADATSWRPVIERGAPTWRTYAVDLRGHGRAERTPGNYRLDDYVDDIDKLLDEIGQPAVLVGHSLGAIIAASLAQAQRPLVAALFLEDPPLYIVEPRAFAQSFGKVFSVLREHITRLQADGAPVETYRDLLAASPHPAGDRLGDHLHDDALWSRAGSLARTDPAAITAALDGTTFGSYDPDRPLNVPGLVVRAEPDYDAAFRPEHEERLHRTSPHIAVVPMHGAGHNIRGDRAGRAGYLDALSTFLAQLNTTTTELQR